MLLEKAITTVSKELDGIEGEVERLTEEREEKKNKPKR